MLPATMAARITASAAAAAAAAGANAATKPASERLRHDKDELS